MGKSYFSSHEKCLARAAVQAGLRPVPTLWLDQPPLGMSKKTDCLKRRASDAPSLFFWRSDSLEHGLNISEAAPSNVRAGPLDSRLENQPFMGLRLCQSRNGATNSTIAEESFPGDVMRQRSKPAEFPEQRVELNTWHPKQRTHAGNETNFEPALNQSKQVQTEFLILTKPLKFDLNAVTKQTYFVRDHFLVS